MIVWFIHDALSFPRSTHTHFLGGGSKDGYAKYPKPPLCYHSTCWTWTWFPFKIWKRLPPTGPTILSALCQLHPVTRLFNCLTTPRCSQTQFPLQSFCTSDAKRWTCPFYHRLKMIPKPSIFWPLPGHTACCALAQWLSKILVCGSSVQQQRLITGPGIWTYNTSRRWLGICNKIIQFLIPHIHQIHFIPSHLSLNHHSPPLG